MIIGLTGTLSSGKDTVADYLKNKGFFHTSLSDLVREECDKRGIPKDRDTLRQTANQMRVLHSNDYFAKLALKKIEDSNAKKSLVVSIRNVDELRRLKENPKFKLIAVDAPVEARYQRAINRGSDKDQISFEKFKAQEDEEMNSPRANEMQMRPIIESADYNINNDGTLEDLYKKTDEILKKFLKENRVKIKIKRVDKTLPLPDYETKGSVAFDLYSRVNTTIESKEIKIVPANLIVEAPEGYFLMLATRSSLPRKKGLMLANSIGIVDQDYCGPEDELCLQLYNFKDTSVEIKRGERLSQAIFMKFTRVKLEEVDEIADKSRGGFGTTGGYQENV